jgi:hypothetical protein
MKDGSGVTVVKVVRFDILIAPVMSRSLYLLSHVQSPAYVTPCGGVCIEVVCLVEERLAVARSPHPMCTNVKI